MKSFQSSFISKYSSKFDIKVSTLSNSILPFSSLSNILNNISVFIFSVIDIDFKYANKKTFNTSFNNEESRETKEIRDSKDIDMTEHSINFSTNNL